MDRDEQEMNLLNYIDVECTITCVSCYGTESIHTDEGVASEIFYDSGWRTTKYGNCYCPKCAKKKLKGLKDESY